MNEKPVLLVERLSFSYRDKPVLKDVSLQLDSGQVVVLSGRNGSGKTTLLRCLAGWMQRTSGFVALCGEPFDGSRQQQRSQMFFINDTPAFYDDLTALEHIRLLLSLNNRKDRTVAAKELLMEFGLYDYKDQLSSSYSRGMRLKLALCLAFTLRPPLILLDEPFGPLDPEATLLLCRLIRQTAEKGSALLLSLHHQIPELNPDLVWKLDGGRLNTSQAQDDKLCFDTLFG